jgi:hypothetical protein
MKRTLHIIVGLLVLGRGALYAEDRSDTPFYYRPALVARARENIERHAWAQKLADEKSAQAEKVCSWDTARLLSYVPAVTPTRTCDCPNCGKSWREYIWQWDEDKPDQVVCRFCKKPMSAKLFPQSGVFTFPDPNGTMRDIPYHAKGKKRFFVESLVAVHQFFFAAEAVVNLTECFLLTRKQDYADKAILLLRKTAEVYPGYVLKYWDNKSNVHFCKQPQGLAGKISGWHYQDAIYVGAMARAYDALKYAGRIGPENAALIEKGLFLEAGKLLAGVSPETGTVNDRAQRYAGVASIARVLGNKSMMRWVTNGRNGFMRFVSEKWMDDGHWCERSPSYAIMALGDVYITPWVMDGYRDSSTAQPVRWRTDPVFARMHTALFDLAWPDGHLPAINDSHVDARTPAVFADIAYAWAGTPEALGRLSRAYDGKAMEDGNEFALWNRDPHIADKLKHLADSPETDHNRSWSNLGVTRLAAGKNDRQTIVLLDHNSYGSHSHFDQLNMVIWAKNREMASDLGYIYWGHRLTADWLTQSLAHNLVVVDERNQDKQGRPTVVFSRLNSSTPVLEMRSPSAYQGRTTEYRRTVALLSGLSNQPVVLDIFRVRGGSTHDWSFHTEAPALKVSGVDVKPIERPWTRVPYGLLRDVHQGAADTAWQAEFRWPDKAGLRVWMTEAEATTVFKATAPGQRTKEQEGRRLPWLLARRTGTNLASTFIAVYEPFGEGTAGVNAVKVVQESSEEEGWPVILKISGTHKTVWVGSKTSAEPWPDDHPEAHVRFADNRFSVN